jgi:tRNA dimethylallyltransferase
MSRLVAIVGPTALGKSDLAIHLARVFHGEIINADSRQVYRYMDIGTAKPIPQELAQVRHHLVSIVDPDQDFGLTQFQSLANQAISNISERGCLPVLVGGSGLYVWSVLEGWRVPGVAPDRDLRRALEERAARGESDSLYAELAELDPVAAQKIDRRNVRRVIRAIEVCRGGDATFSQLQLKEKPPFEPLIIGLTAARDELYRRIDRRVDYMIDSGLVDEVKGLLAAGYGYHLPAMSGIGYKQIAAYLKGEIDLEEAVQQTKYETHRFARHQYSWFRLKDDRIKWFDIQGDLGRVDLLVSGFLKDN